VSSWRTLWRVMNSQQSIRRTSPNARRKRRRWFRWESVHAFELCTCEKFHAHRRANDVRRRDDVTKIATFQHSCQTVGAESLFGLSHEPWWAEHSGTRNRAVRCARVIDGLNAYSFTIYRYLREGVTFQRYSSRRRVTEYYTFLGICSHFGQSGHLRLSQTPSRWVCCPVQGIGILNIVKRIAALRLREVAIATSTWRRRASERESNHGSRLRPKRDSAPPTLSKCSKAAFFVTSSQRASFVSQRAQNLARIITLHPNALISVKITNVACARHSATFGWVSINCLCEKLPSQLRADSHSWGVPDTCEEISDTCELDVFVQFWRKHDRAIRISNVTVLWMRDYRAVGNTKSQTREIALI